MSYRQVRRPNVNVKAWAGSCLEFVQLVFGIASRGAVDFSAWNSWLNQTGKHVRGMPTNVAVVVWFSHYGRYGIPIAYWDNWGHVVAWIPGRGYLSSPGSGFGAMWFPTIAAVEIFFNARYVGWTTHLHGVPLVEWIRAAVRPKPKPQPAPIIQEDEDEMATRLFIRIEGKEEACVCDPSIGLDLRGDQKRKSGKHVTVFRGHMVSTSPDVIAAWGYLYGKGDGAPHARFRRKPYMSIQSEARRMSEQLAITA